MQEIADTQIAEALKNASDSLISRQDPQGWWKGELETNVTIEAGDLFMRQFMGISQPELLSKTANWIRSKQREDGTWANFYRGAPELSTTTEAYAALRLAGDSMDAPHMKSARKYILDSGGLERTRVFTRIWMALFGEYPYEKLPTLLPEMIFLPKWMPFNIYNFACWARQTIAPLLILGAHKPVRPVLGFKVDELKTGLLSAEREKRPISTQAGRLQVLDKAAGLYDRISIGPLRRRSIKKLERWILERQEADGCWGGIQPPWIYSIMALSVLGYENDHPVIKKALGGFESFEILEGDTRRLECCQSPIWDTALALIALADAGVETSHPSFEKAAIWILDEEVTQKGDWSVKRPKLDPGGWAFEFENDNYPDVDDTAEVILALERVEQTPEIKAAIQRGINWLEGMQSKDGGYGAFDVDNNKTILRELPFSDFGAVIDPPTADVTAHAVEMLAKLKTRGYKINPSRLEAAVKWLRENQEQDGSWYGRWGSNYIYGTAAAVPALIEAGAAPDDPQIQAALNWLRSVQKPDGGWGEDLDSYDDASLKGSGESTASQTAWAVMAFMAAGDAESARSGVTWLVSTQKEDGTWDEPYFTGTGFPGDFYINYHLYRDVFPVSAIGRYLSFQK